MESDSELELSDKIQDADESTLSSDKETEVGNYAVVQLFPQSRKNKPLHYVAFITDKNEENSVFIVQFFRQSKKMPGRFVEPKEDDIGEIKQNAIVRSLPPPISVGGTKVIKSMLSFPVDLTKYDCE